MVKNTKISLSKDSKYRKEARGMLQYTFFLDMKELNPNTKDKDENNSDKQNPDKNAEQKIAYIQNLLNDTQKSCQKIFGCKGSPSNYDFFGYIAETKENRSNAFNNENFHDILLKNSLLTCYHAILSELLSNCNVTAYQITNNLRDCGPYYTYLKKHFSHQENMTLKFKKTKLSGDSQESKRQSGNASDFNKVMSARQNQLPEFIGYLFDEEKNRYVLQFISLCHQLRNKKTNVLHRFTDPETKTLTTSKSSNPQEKAENYSSSLINCIESIKPTKNRQDDDTTKNTDVSSSLKNCTKTANPPKKDDYTIKKMDSIYYWYITEKTFGFHLLYTLYQNMKKVSSTSFFGFEDEYAQKTLAKFSKLPNSLTRTFICNSVFNYIDAKTNSYADYWSYRKYSQRNAVATMQFENEQGFNFYKWLSQCNLFIDYLCDIIVPVYDWYMLITLLEDIEKQYPSPGTDHLEHLGIALDRIQTYVASVYPSPDGDNIFLDSNIGTANDLSKILYEIDINTIRKFHSTYYQDWDVELNIKPLTRDIFTKKNPLKSETYFEDIRNLYLEALYISPLNSL